MKNSNDPVGYDDIRNILTTVDLLSKKGKNPKSSTPGFKFSQELLNLAPESLRGNTQACRRIATLFAQELQNSVIKYNPLGLDSTQPRSNPLDRQGNEEGLLTNEQIKDLNSCVIQYPTENPTGKHVPLYMFRERQDGSPLYLGGFESIDGTSGVIDFDRMAKQTFFADPNGNTTEVFRSAQEDFLSEKENGGPQYPSDPIVHLKSGISETYHSKASFENSTAILSTAQTFYTNSYAVPGNLNHAQDFKSYKAADLQAKDLDGELTNSPIACPIYQAYNKDTDIIKMKEYYLEIPVMYHCKVAERDSEIKAYVNDTETKLQGIINGLLNQHYNDPNTFEAELIAAIKQFPGASLLVVDNGVQKHAINYVGTEPDAAMLVLSSVECLSNWDTQTKCREVLEQLNAKGTQYTAETFLQALRLPTKSFEHNVMQGFFMKLGVSLVVIGKRILNWLLPRTPPRYPTLSRSGLRDLWNDNSSLRQIHSMLVNPKKELSPQSDINPVRPLTSHNFEETTPSTLHAPDTPKTSEHSAPTHPQAQNGL